MKDTSNEHENVEEDYRQPVLNSTFLANCSESEFVFASHLSEVFQKQVAVIRNFELFT